MAKVHDFDGAWKTILEAFERELVEVLFPEIYEQVDWSKPTEAMDNELLEIQKEIFEKESTEKIISDKIIKLHFKDSSSKLIFIHVEVQSSNRSNENFGERMFRYFYRIWDRFRYKYRDSSEIIAAAIYTYRGTAGKDKEFVYKVPNVEDEILKYSFRTIDVENLKLEDVSDENPLKFVFKAAKKLLEVGANQQSIYESKIKLATELDKLENLTVEQSKALVDFLEYLFLLDDEL